MDDGDLVPVNRTLEMVKKERLVGGGEGLAPGQDLGSRPKAPTEGAAAG